VTAGYARSATWTALLADGVAPAADRFRQRVRRSGGEIFGGGTGDEHELVFTTFGRLAVGVDDPAGRAAALAVLGRWFRANHLWAGHLWVLGESLLHVLTEANRTIWSGRIASAWDEAFRAVSLGLLRSARRVGDGPVRWAGEVVGHEVRAPGIAVLTVRPDRPLPYRPGQAVPVGLPGWPGVWRWYCPANAPCPDGTVEFHVRAVGGGVLSRVLVDRVRPGQRLWLGPAAGRSLVPGRVGRRDLLLVAGGTGLAPLRAIVDQVVGSGPQGRTVTLVAGARTVDELYDAITLDTWQRAYDWLTVLPALSADPEVAHPVERGTAMRVALRHEWPEHDIFVCGPAPMVRDALPRLVVAGYPLARIHLPDQYDDVA
jgi:NAD(P)H-flavin reductase